MHELLSSAVVLVLRDERLSHVGHLLIYRRCGLRDFVKLLQKPQVRRGLPLRLVLSVQVDGVITTAPCASWCA